MKLISILLLAACMEISAEGHTQQIILHYKDSPLERVIKDIEKQTLVSFIYSKAAMQLSRPVTIDMTTQSLELALKECFRNQPIHYVVEENFIILKTKPEIIDNGNLPLDISGKVVNENNEPIVGITVQVKGKKMFSVTDAVGDFTLEDIPKDAVLVLSGAEVETKEIPVAGRSHLLITLKQKIDELDETIVMAYGTTSRRFTTGNIGKVRSEEISRQPITNPIAALQGRIPGLVITQTNGYPGSAYKILIRGQNSIAQGSEPLIVLDGIPLSTSNSSINQITSALGANASARGASPLNAINPSDIESIEILKDADATSIYGSLGANGVVVITTKKGRAGKTTVSANLWQGFSRVTRTMDMLDTRQYVGMRNEAFANDGIIPNQNNAYDLILWDTSRYTDFKDLLIGGTASNTNAVASVSGGTAATQFLFSTGYHRSTTVLPGDFAYNRSSGHLNLRHRSSDQRLSINLTGLYSFERNNLVTSDLSGFINSSIPNLPELYDSSGKLKWQEKGINFINPLSFLYKTYTYRTHTFSSNINISYRFFKGFWFHTDMGYNSIQTNEQSTNPIASQNPTFNPKGSSSFASALSNAFSIEPQFRLKTNFGNGRLEVLAGLTLLNRRSESSRIDASGYSNDNLLKYSTAAPNIQVSNTAVLYKYNAIFGRANYILKDRYIINLSIRRDGSSRFGPGRQFASFGSASGGWIFSSEPFIARHIPFVNFGKLRASYGSSGNDNIGDYRYLSNWRANRYQYQGSPGLYPSSLFNPDYSWEINRKFESAIDLGFFKNRLMLSVAYFQNRCSNQLVQYALPTQTGFTGILANFPATVENKGWEMELSAKIFERKDFNWNSAINISVPRNKLLAFPGVATSSYSYLMVGEPLSIYNGFRFLGVDPATGIFQFADLNGNPTSSPSSSSDFIRNLGNTEIRVVGGMSNDIRYNNFSLNLLFEFKVQPGPNFLYYSTSNIPGRIYNQFVNVFDRWQHPGDNTQFQKYSQDGGGTAAQAANRFNSFDNDAKYSDASYIRFRNASLSYTLPTKVSGRLRIENVRLYMQCQNILTITNYLGADPETRNSLTMPPLKTYTVGLQITF